MKPNPLMIETENKTVRPNKAKKKEPKRIRAVVHVLAPLNGTIKKIGQKYGFEVYRLLQRWDLLVGPDLARICAPKRLKKAKGATQMVLELECDHAFAPEISVRSEEIINRVNAALGSEKIKGIRLLHRVFVPQTRKQSKQESTPPASHEKAMVEAVALPKMLADSFENVHDSAFKAALERLAQTYYQS